jgi:capsular exopolysaccharide synthesis family protein
VSQRSSPDDAVDLRVYGEVLRRRWRLAVAVLIVVVALAALYSFTRPVAYTVEAQVLVDPGSSALGLRPDQLVSMETEARLVASAIIATRVRDDFEASLTSPELLENVSVEATPESLVLDIAYTAPTSRDAARTANAFADAYLAYRRQRAEDKLNDERAELSKLMEQLQIERDQYNADINVTAPGTIEYRNARQRRDLLNQRIASLSIQLTEIPLTVDPGEVILPATADAAEPSPNHLINLALGLFLGLFAGVVAAFIRERTDDRIGSRTELEGALGAPTVAMIPHMPGRTLRRTPYVVVEQQPRSPAAEAYRTLRTSVMARSRQRSLRLIGVTGAAMGEGKTTTATNLAAALAQADQNVLAISADLRRPKLHTYFSLNDESGLSDLLTDATSFEKAARKVRNRLHVMSSGSQTSQPAEVLESPRLAELLNRVRDEFDFVVIDLPPALGLADTLVVAPLLDGVLVVAEAERTTQAAIRHTVDQLVQVGAVVEGGVLNNVSPSRLAEYRYGYEYAEKNGSSGRRQRDSAPSAVTMDEPAVAKPSTVANASTVTKASTVRKTSTSEQKRSTAKPATRRGKW